MEPDKSTNEDLHTTLQQLPFAVPTSLYEYETQWQDDEHAWYVTWDCLHPKERWCGSADLSADTLKALWLSIDYDLSFGDAVQKFGPPEQVGYLRDPWQTRCEISLEWSDKGVSITGSVWKTCPKLEAPDARAKVNPYIRVSSVYYTSPEALRWFKDKAARDYQGWPGLEKGPLVFLGLIPGDSTMWLTILGCLVALVILAFQKPRWPTAGYSFTLAAIAVFSPTVQFQFSDIITPMCGAYFVNTLLCGFVFIILAESVKQLGLRRSKAVKATRSNSTMS